MKESLVYLNILEYIKNNGTSEFNQLFTDVCKLENCISKNDDTIEKMIIDLKIEQLDSLVKDNIRLIKFLNTLRNKNINFLSRDFKYFIRNIELNINQIDKYIENARKLVLLGIDTITFINLGSSSFYQQSEIHYDSDTIVKSYVTNDNEPIYFKSGNIKTGKVIYTDGKIELLGNTFFDGKGTINHPFVNNRAGNDETYKLGIVNATFILENEKTSNYRQLKYIIIKDFGFNADKLPSEEELKNINEPEYVKEYKKHLV